MTDTVEGFRQRARFEARRYGTDPWVFVRELLQNARDAGARQVRFTVEHRDGIERISCRDDGEGMSFNHAEQYLFTLYASSKDREGTAAGKFGIGFWSVLRFDPERIVIRSRSEGDDGWQVALDGSLDTATRKPMVMNPGTEIILERPVRSGDPVERVLQAIRDDARLIRCRDEPETELSILLNDEPVKTGTELPEPYLEFSRRGLRGGVALSSEPKVEVFAHGLRVRSAAFLDELLSEEPRRRTRPQAELPEGLLPRVVLDSEQLEVLMARGDAREDRSLRRLVALAQGELGRLVRSELDRAAPRSLARRLLEGIAQALRSDWLWFVGALFVLGCIVGVVLWLQAPVEQRRLEGVDAAEPVPTAIQQIAPAMGSPSWVAYEDISRHYRGPTVDGLAHETAVDLSYRPTEAEPLFAVLRVTDLSEAGTVQPSVSADILTPYLGAPCVEACLEIELRVDGRAGSIRVPVATGHAIDPATLTLDGASQPLFASDRAEPFLQLDRDTQGTLRYTSGPAPAAEAQVATEWAPLPAGFSAAVAEFAELPPAERVDAVTELIGSRVRYDRSPQVALRHVTARGMPFFDRALAIGAGDCDVQNALLAATLDGIGLPSRLAIGYAGSGGSARPGLHAWVEYLDRGFWQVADASFPESAYRPELQPAAAGAISEARERALESPTGAGRTDTTRSRGSASPVFSWAWPWITVLALAAAAGIVFLARWRHRALRRELHTGEGGDLARLVRGAMLRPQAYRHVDPLFSRPIVPLVGGAAASLRKLWRLAQRGALFRSDEQTRLAELVAGTGRTVIDAASEVGRVVADLLGARDLDAWEGVVERSYFNPATELVESSLRRFGERCHIRVAARPPDSVATMEGGPLGFERRSRVVVVDEASELWRIAGTALTSRPEWAAFVLADGIAHVFDMTPERRSGWLSSVARLAIADTAGAVE